VGGGGGLFVSHVSSVTINNHSVISCNNVTGTQGGGGILLGSSVTTATISDSQVFRNQASGGGGGGLNVGTAAVTLTNDVFEFNSGLTGGGVFRPGLSSSTVTLTNTVVAGNSATAAPHVGPDLNGTFATGGNNTIGNGSGETGISGPGDKVGTPSKPIKPPVKVPPC
jgi:hypothetical protein